MLPSIGISTPGICSVEYSILLRSCVQVFLQRLSKLISPEGKGASFHVSNNLSSKLELQRMCGTRLVILACLRVKFKAADRLHCAVLDVVDPILQHQMHYSNQ